MKIWKNSSQLRVLICQIKCIKFLHCNKKTAADYKLKQSKCFFCLIFGIQVLYLQEKKIAAGFKINYPVQILQFIYY